jgi:hypothetical protein
MRHGYSGFLNRCNGPEPTQAIPSGIDLSALFASAVPTDPRRWHPVPENWVPKSVPTPSGRDTRGSGKRRRPAPKAPVRCLDHGTPKQ